MSREESRNINWNEVIKKEARGKNDEDLGEVQGVKYFKKASYLQRSYSKKRTSN
jgi:hypothetical protein